MHDSVPAHPLTPLFAPTSIALIGASERNIYSKIAVQNLRDIGFAGDLFMVNVRGGTAFGHPAHTSCSQLPMTPDVAYVSVPANAVLSATADVFAAGIRNAVIVTSGFSEVGDDGAARERELLELARHHGAQILGPNCLGYLNYQDRVAVGAISAETSSAGRVGLVSVSGACARETMRFANRLGLGFGLVVATGNETNVSMMDVADYMLARSDIDAVALFAEAVKDPRAFVALGDKARRAHKPIVILKVGSAPATAAIARAHTGAIVGDDAVFSAVCERLGIIRVSTFEDLAICAHTVARCGVLPRPGIAIISTSGGMCDVVSDLADVNGVVLPDFAPGTVSAMKGIVSELGGIHNPIDLTGAVARDFTIFTRSIETLARDPSIGLVVVHQDPAVTEPGATESLMDSMVRQQLDAIAEGFAKTALPPFILTSFGNALTDYGVRDFARRGLLALPGVTDGMMALGKAAWWSAKMRAGGAHPPGAAAGRLTASRPTGEVEVMQYLRERRVRVIETVIAGSATAAVAAADAMGYPVALKICAPTIEHKTEAGGVELRLQTSGDVRQAFDRIMTSVSRHAPAAPVQGVSVARMRSGGVELVVGFKRDPQWGMVMAVGLGGVWVEVLKDVALFVLPVTAPTVASGLRSLRGARLLTGYRNSPPIDIDAVADAAVAIAEAVLALGDDLLEFEVNPLFADATRIEVLDALAVWRSGI